MQGHLKYRADIDGLRAIAILSVLAYHCSEALLPGGFTGVDIFFVISGYLITQIIASSVEQGTFSIAEFYVRRAKRILPALFTVLLVTLLVGAILLAPSELAQLGKTAAATATFVSNFTFWLDTGYFDAAADRKPLLHTWSLAVEEQFYLLWPVALILAWKLRLSRLWLVITVAMLSFAVSCYAAVIHPPSAFFLLPSRAWELLIGATLALGFVPVFAGRRTRDACALLGLALVLSGLFYLDESSMFPGWNALLPCVGAALLIHAGHSGENIVSRYLLSQRPMVFVGLISYSLYLWHWPLLSLARVTQDGPLSVVQTVGVVSLAMLLSVTTWRFVEKPLRAKGPTHQPAPFLLRYAVVSAAVLGIGIYIHQSSGLLEFASPQIVKTELARRDGNPISDECLRYRELGQLASPNCILGEEKFSQRVAIWGDSHADSAVPGLAEQAAKLGYATHQLTMAACPPLIGAKVEGPGFDGSICQAFNQQVLEYVRSASDIKAVVLVGRWPVYTENSRFGPDDFGPITYLVDGRDTTWSSSASKRVFSRALANTIKLLRQTNKHVIVMGAIPALGINLPECIARNHLPFSEDRDCNIKTELVMARLRYTDSEIKRIAAGQPGVCSYLPRTVMCPGERCLGTAGDEILYANDDHLSSRGSRYLARRIDLSKCIVATASGHPGTAAAARFLRPGSDS